jgi:hypothetical protein
MHKASQLRFKFNVKGMMCLCDVVLLAQVAISEGKYDLMLLLLLMIQVPELKIFIQPFIFSFIYSKGISVGEYDLILLLLLMIQVPDLKIFIHSFII